MMLSKWEEEELENWREKGLMNDRDRRGKHINPWKLFETKK